METDQAGKVAATARRTRFLQINTFYPAYLTDFYAARPHLMDARYETQINALLDDGFADSHIFTRPLRAHGRRHWCRREAWRPCNRDRPRW